ncbi:hypothetical protein IAD21_03476 [Abditibacteriota bacterium]|nr:hypothetical protein IAD21_03476 [Abditibacteriota bacterium]
MIYDEFVDFLAREIPPQASIDFRPSPELEARLEELLSANSRGELSRDEQRELEQFRMLEHVLRLLKAKARQSILATPAKAA